MVVLQGAVFDGFPGTQTQAMLMEKSLNGVDLEMEEAIASTVSRIAPPPEDYLPDPNRQLTSGLDAVFLLDLSDEQKSIERALGRRINHEGQEVHLEDVNPDEKDKLGEANALQVGHWKKLSGCTCWSYRGTLKAAGRLKSAVDRMVDFGGLCVW